MANPTLSDLRTRVRANCRDNSGTAGNRSLSDAAINGYINLFYRLVQRKYAPRIAFRTSTQTGLSLAQNAYTDTTDETNYSRIIAILSGTGASSNIGSPLNQKSVDEIIAMRGNQSSDGTTTGAGTYGVVTDTGSSPVFYAAFRLATTTPTDQGKWFIIFHPPNWTSGAIPFSALVELEQADLSGDTDSPDVPAEGCSLIEAGASYLACKDLKRDNAESFMTVYPELKELLDWKTRDEAKNQGRGNRA